MGSLGPGVCAVVAAAAKHRNPSRKRWRKKSPYLEGPAISGRCFASSVALATPCGVGSDRARRRVFEGDNRRKKFLETIATLVAGTCWGASRFGWFLSENGLTQEGTKGSWGEGAEWLGCCIACFFAGRSWIYRYSRILAPCQRRSWDTA